MDFTAIDVETANPDLSSICQIGVVQFRNGAIANRWKTFVNPEDYFDPANVSVHGIMGSDVAHAPTLSEIAGELHGYLTASIVCHHTSFDRTSVHSAHVRHSIPLPEVQWLDTARVVRRTWPDRSRSGYGLRPVAEMLGIAFTHHDAEEDARVAGEILLHAMALSGLSATEWLVRVNRPISTRPVSANGSGYTESHAREGNPEGPLYGENVVFTGALSLPRRQAAAMAAEAGCDVGDQVTKSTTLLIVGDQDVARLAGHKKSTKHRKAEELIGKGQPIRVLRETDFLAMIADAGVAE